MAHEDPRRRHQPLRGRGFASCRRRTAPCGLDLLRDSLPTRQSVTRLDSARAATTSPLRGRVSIWRIWRLMPTR